MRNESCVTSAQYSLASSLAMPDSTSKRAPESLSRAAFTIIRCAASTLVAISASLNAMAWCCAIGFPNVERCALVLATRLAERRALLGVLDGQLERPDRDPARPRRDVHPSHLDAVHHLREATPALAAQDVRGGERSGREQPTCSATA